MWHHSGHEPPINSHRIEEAQARNESLINYMLHHLISSNSTSPASVVRCVTDGIGKLITWPVDGNDSMTFGIEFDYIVQCPLAHVIASLSHAALRELAAPPLPN